MIAVEIKKIHTTNTAEETVYMEERGTTESLGTRETRLQKRCQERKRGMWKEP